jgi:hypothetical protein
MTATPPPGTMPSSTAARVAWRASSTRAFFSFISLGGCTDVDDGDTAGELGEALLELLAVVVGGGLFDLTADLVHAAADVLFSCLHLR